MRAGTAAAPPTNTNTSAVNNTQYYAECIVHIM